jgi:hypothetical protein
MAFAEFSHQSSPKASKQSPEIRTLSPENKTSVSF